MKADILKKEIQAYLDKPEVLTKSEATELLEDCLDCFLEQEQKKSEFHKTYEGIMDNARARQAEAHSILGGVADLTDMLKGLNVPKK